MSRLPLMYLFALAVLLFALYPGIPVVAGDADASIYLGPARG